MGFRADHSDAKTKRLRFLPGRVGGAGAFLRSRTARWALVLFLYAALLLLFCTRNSPLFVLQDWIDPNIYMDVGNAVRHGKVLYRDVFDHKGPFLLLTFSLLSAIAPGSMIGLYILQSVCLGFTLLYLFRMARLFLSERAAFGSCLVFPVFLLNFLTYGQGGGSAEELMLPLFMGGLYYLVRFFSAGKDLAGEDQTGYSLSGNGLSGSAWTDKPGQEPAFFLSGLFAGIVFLSKMNLAAFFLAGFGPVFLLFLLRKEWNHFFRAAGRFLGGIAAASLPCLVYFAATGSFSDFIDVYFLFNMRYAAQPAAVSFPEAVWTALFLNLAAFLCACIGMSAFPGKKSGGISRPGLGICAAAFLCTTAAAFSSCRSYQYMYIPLLPFTGAGEIGILLALRKSRNRQRPHRHRQVPILTAVLLALIPAVVIASNTLILESRLFAAEKTGTERIADTIMETWQPEEDGKDPSILLFDSGDMGFYRLTRTSPDLRVFYMPMIRQSVYPDLVTQQFKYVAQGLPDYIITVWYEKEYFLDLSDTNPDYRVIDRQEQYYDERLVYITLYARAEGPSVGETQSGMQ